ncbi:hypothetical protein BDP55DRAFT_226469 [Colletotrichum godetiae]|uniref:Uncharacterized protein n=1 Tax=Colletotrichum godetiae TaxID=1209918 RepID=A0AAJ0AKQ0_9PEZI|nr:uncharacterized protein BDP55DRAFT_226469 [Colletotrichum godetiae]KAK1673501.1 hypothetical protein BDP55DRAFT_226469 [Colletotrichum godetiae]
MPSFPASLLRRLFLLHPPAHTSNGQRSTSILDSSILRPLLHSSSIRPFFPPGHPYLMIRCRPSNAGLRHSRKKGCHPESAPTRPLRRPPPRTWSLGLLGQYNLDASPSRPVDHPAMLQPSATTYRTLPHISFSYQCTISRTDI